MKLSYWVAIAILTTMGAGSASAQSFVPTTTIYGAPNSGDATVGGTATNGANYKFTWMTVNISYKTYTIDQNGNVVTTVTQVYASGVKNANPFTHLYTGVVGRTYDVDMQARFDATRPSNPPYQFLNASTSFVAP